MTLDKISNEQNIALCKYNFHLDVLSMQVRYLSFRAKLFIVTFGTLKATETRRESQWALKQWRMRLAQRNLSKWTRTNLSRMRWWKNKIVYVRLCRRMNQLWPIFYLQEWSVTSPTLRWKTILNKSWGTWWWDLDTEDTCLDIISFAF